MIKIILLIFFVLGCFFLLKDSHKDHMTFNQCGKIPTFENPHCVSIGIQMMKDVFQIFERHRVILWITYGTLLGHVRHGGFIPWDNDIDCLSLKENSDIINGSIKKELEGLGYIVQPKYSDSGKELQYFEIHYNKDSDLHMDIGLCTKLNIKGEEYLVDGPVENHQKILDDPDGQKGWLHKIKNTFPLQNTKLYDIDIHIPANPVAIVKDIYGDSCMVLAKIKKFSHIGGFDENLEETNITKFYPAQKLKMV
ncbi:MAG TPA: LicD family protein [Saprospiraceae bacterium]|nr:LicD family protein [Saprospiraceae bacterium]